MEIFSFTLMTELLFENSWILRISAWCIILKRLYSCIALLIIIPRFLQSIHYLYYIWYFYTCCSIFYKSNHIWVAWSFSAALFWLLFPCWETEQLPPSLGCTLEVVWISSVPANEVLLFLNVLRASYPLLPKALRFVLFTALADLRATANQKKIFVWHRAQQDLCLWLSLLIVQ